MGTTTLTGRLNGALSVFVGANVAEDGAYEEVSECTHDLIRRDKERSHALAFERLKAELARAFSAPEESYKPLSAGDVIKRNN